MKNRYILGIDTSNYTTSAAVTTVEGEILSDSRRLLTVKKGNRGLRQQDALFQHVMNLPDIISDAMKEIRGEDLAAICVSTRPRNVEGSYMPCFLAGSSAAKTLGEILGIPVYETSHQEGHLAAASYGTSLEYGKSFVFCHLSGGTCEIIDVTEEGLTIAGGSLDISFGQLLDRTGVAMGLDFPCGSRLDAIALSSEEETSCLGSIRCADGSFNLSGIETQIMREIEKGNTSPAFVREIFTKVSDVLFRSIRQVCDNYGKKDVLLAGGVSSSQTLRNTMDMEHRDMNIVFGDPGLCSDNAAGVSLLGGRIWQQNR